ncbi:MAG TPA: type II toxin-antitoxin system Phd/YefM family antitoxin [Polyangia bacterium]|nr:type II toxin-antitoxin system Phd/YefM family antitoxin [Polyangia bacterium]
MKTVNVHDVKNHFSELLARVEQGEEVVIARAGNPVARLVPEKKQLAPTFGADRGKFTIPNDFDGPLPDYLLADFDARGRK